MLDTIMRPIIDPPLNKAGEVIARFGVPANTVTVTGFTFGMIAAVCVANSLFIAGLILLLLNRLCDGLDGGVARFVGISDLGGFLDIVLDFIFYASIPLAFCIARPEHALHGAFLLFCFMACACSFLAYAIMASKRQKTTTARGQKSLYYLGGICEGTETFFVLALICLIPEHFNLIALIYGALCLITAAGRIFQAILDFKEPTA